MSHVETTIETREPLHTLASRLFAHISPWKEAREPLRQAWVAIFDFTRTAADFLNDPGSNAAHDDFTTSRHQARRQLSCLATDPSVKADAFHHQSVRTAATLFDEFNGHPDLKEAQAVYRPTQKYNRIAPPQETDIILCAFNDGRRETAFNLISRLPSFDEETRKRHADLIVEAHRAREPWALQFSKVLKEYNAHKQRPAAPAPELLAA